jgi:hypothetical protein
MHHGKQQSSRWTFVACAAILAVMAFLLNPSAPAQNAQGTILGHVTDSSGAAIAGAKVTVRNLNTNVKNIFVTDASGDYVVPELNPGSYSVTTEAAGFRTSTSSNLLLEVQQTLRQDFKLVVGAVSETVNVSADAQMLQTDDATIGQVLQGDMVQQLPLSGRDFTNLILTSIGANITPGGIASVGYFHGLNTGYFEVSLNGAQAQSTSYSIDGVYDADYFYSVPINIPNEMAIQEFKMENGVYGADAGQGAAQVNVSIKSGTNNYHGGLYETYQGNILQPDNQLTALENQINNTSTNTSPPYVQNQFGGAVGGPVNIPFLYKGKDRSFWFVSYDGGRYTATNAPTSILAPSTAEMGGDFSAWPYPIYDPLTTVPNPAYVCCTQSPTNSPVIRTQFPGNKIPTARFDSIAQRIVAAGDWNTPNVSTCTDAASIGPSFTQCANYSGTTNTIKQQDTETVRFDQYLGDKDHIFFTGNLGIMWDKATKVQFGTGTTIYARPKLFGSTWTHNFGPKTLSTATLGYVRDHFYTGPATAYGPNLSVNAGFVNTLNNPVSYDLPSIGVTDYYTIGGGSPTTWVDDIYQGKDDVALIRGRHSMSFGIDFRRLQLYETDDASGTGVLSFNGQYTASVPGLAGGSMGKGGVPSANAPYEGNPFADFLLGDSKAATGPAPVAADLYTLWGNNTNLYFQDLYQITPRLTLNLGLRWERPANLHANDNSGFAFNPSNGGSFSWANCNFTNSISALPGVKSYYLGCGASNTLVPIDNRDFAPRFGFSYRPWFSSKLVVRGGFGFFYGTYNRYYDGAKFDRDSLYNEVTAPYSPTTGSETQSTAVMKNLWIAPLVNNTSFTLPGWESAFHSTVWPHNKNPYDEQWSLDTQYALKPSLMLDIGYAGDAGRRESTQLLIGAATPPKVAGDTCNNLVDASQASAACLADPNFQPMDAREPYANMPPYFFTNYNGFNSSYNALQVQLIQRPWHGMMYHLNYTYSKSMNLTSGINNITGEYALLQNPQNPKSEYGLAASDQTHHLTGTYAYQIPDHLLKGRLLNDLASGWTTSGVYQLASGFPFEVKSGVATDQMAENYTSRYTANSTFQTKSGFSKSLTEWFDISKYSVTPLGTYGNTNKSPERGPYYTDWDTSFGKTTHIGEQRTIVIRADFYNTASTWHDNDVLPTSTVTSGVFGSFEATPAYGPLQVTWAPRNLQLSAKFNF